MLRISNVFAGHVKKTRDKDIGLFLNTIIEQQEEEKSFTFTSQFLQHLLFKLASEFIIKGKRKRCKYLNYIFNFTKRQFSR